MHAKPTMNATEGIQVKSSPVYMECVLKQKYAQTSNVVTVSIYFLIPPLTNIKCHMFF
jgi:hypothetical protein